MLSNIRSLGLGIVAAASVALCRMMYADLYVGATDPYTYAWYYIVVGIVGFGIFWLGFGGESLIRAKNIVDRT